MRRRIHATGWGLIALAVGTVIVTVGAFQTHGINHWAGWARAAAVLLAALGILLVVLRYRPARPAPPRGAPPRPIVDDDVRFTVYRPQALSPGQWALLLVFAHKTTVVKEPGRAPVDPQEQVETRARAHFGGTPPRPVSEDARHTLIRGTRLRIVPDLDGIQCNPRDAEVEWWESVHEIPFRLLAGPELAGTVVRGAVRVWCGAVILGEVSIAIPVTADGPVAEAPPVEESVRRYRKIFPSYSHQDHAIVENFALVHQATGDQYLQDILSLRSGEQWNPRLRELIEAADVFQLFWSHNSMRSPHCRDEWEHALALDRPLFVRPVYWEEPLPEDPGQGLPPTELRALHFVKVPAGPGLAGSSLIPAPREGEPKPTTGRSRWTSAAAVAGAAAVLAATLTAIGTLRGGLQEAPHPKPGSTATSGRIPSPLGLWTYTTGGPVRSSPAVADDTVYIGSSDHNIYALDAATGRPRWTFTTAGPVNSGPAVAGGTVYIGSSDHKVYALNAATGHLRWTFITGGPVYSSPAVADGTVYVGSSDDSVYALNAATGHLRWRYITGGPVNSRPAVAGGTVYIGSNDANVYALNAATGHLRWRYTTGGPVNSSPTVAGGTVYIGSNDAIVYALNAATGSPRWAFNTGGPVYSSPAVADHTVYIGSDDKAVYAIEAAP